jgi:hypothetical protein
MTNEPATQGITDELLQSFCCVDDIRHYLNAPLTFRPYTYATNGHVCVRVDAGDRDESETQLISATKFVPALASAEENATEFVAVVLPPMPAFAPCITCDGTGKRAECAECDGTGEVTCEYDHEHECPRCDGVGRIAGAGTPCEDCRGATVDRYSTHPGDIDKRKVAIGAADIDWNLLEMIARLPNVTIGVALADNTAVPFRFDGGIGAVMPLRKRT